jgi:NitT/TauT family transport system ATP-binding protein
MDDPMKSKADLLPSGKAPKDRETPPGSRAAGPQAAVAATNVCFSYRPDSPVILEDITLTAGEGEILVLIGPSGCGKSTVLNLVAGMLKPTEGTMESSGKPLTGLNRRVTYMTQKDTLLPWRNALDNAALPLEIRGVPKRARYERARQTLDRVGLAGSEDLRPHQMSGGMRGRLSLARSLLSDTDILLMDEPFAAIDALGRLRLQQLLVSIWEETRKTIIYVTHDLNEAVALGHRVIVMSARPGRLYLEQEIPTPHPRNVARFLTSPQARECHGVLWDALEKQLRR